MWDRDKSQKKQGPFLNLKGSFTFYSLIISILITALLADSLLSDVSSIVNRALPESTRTILFSTIVGITIISGGYVVQYLSKRLKDEFGSNNRLLLLVSWAIPFVQYLVIGILILITAQIIITKQYLTLLLLVASFGISWSAGIVLLGMMAIKFLNWYRAKSNLIVLLYFVMSLFMCLILALASIPQIIMTSQISFMSVDSQSTEIKSFQVDPGKFGILFVIISIANWLVIPLSLIIWVTIAAMLSGYSRIIGRLKYWIMLSAPLVSVIIGVTSLLVFLPSINTIFDQEVIFYTMMAFGGMLLEGFLLGFAFKTVSNNIRDKSSIKINKALSISAIGVVMFFICYFANPSIGSYLPFGVISSSFLGFGAYLFFSGIFSSAVSIASDLKLRQTIRQSLLDRSKLLDNIGMADITRELERHTEDIIRKHEETMKRETGIDSPIHDVDMQRYIEEAMAEIRKSGGDSSEK